jgi:hypothetical protein
MYEVQLFGRTKFSKSYEPARGRCGVRQELAERASTQNEVKHQQTGKRIMAYWVRTFHNPYSKKFFEVTSDETNLPRLRARISKLKKDPEWEDESTYVHQHALDRQYDPPRRSCRDCRNWAGPSAATYKSTTAFPLAMPTALANTRRNWSRSRRSSGLAAGNPHGANCVCTGPRSRRQRSRCEPGAAGWQRHRPVAPNDRLRGQAS